MLQPYIPEGFDAFWEETSHDAMQHPLHYERNSAKEYALEGFGLETLHFKGIRGDVLHGWIATPVIRSSNESLPAFLWLPHYSRNSMLPNEFGTREGFVSLSFNFFGHSAFHRETYTPERGYLTQGIEEPHTWIFREMFQNAMIAARILQSLKEVHPQKVASMGMSQGGGMSIWLGAWCASIIQAVCADMPFLVGMSYVLAKTVYRYPTKEIIDFIGEDSKRREKVLRTLSYFDTLNIATRCLRPVQVSYGLKDPASPSDTIRALYKALAGPKKLIEYPMGHDWHPDMVANNRGFLLETL